ncbi:hypothetical protein [Paraburkholderia bannensis]|uniref:hypothetical protein n=1 Tax=Paraburkholderia bannensis TaxID=765414 RepID=UPI002ABE252D|nr:hypothetical protein [Paraburkholderia bannensis]
MSATRLPAHAPQHASPYAVRDLDAAIAHLEIAVKADARAGVFGTRYWLERVRQAKATPGIVIAQARRLERLQKQLGERLTMCAKPAQGLPST